MRVPRSRGAVGGIVITVLGLWGALIPFVGPYFNYSIGSTDTWDWSSGRLWLSVIPGAVAVIGGLLMIGSRSRSRVMLGALLGVAAGAWFVCGPTVSELWNHGVSQAGALHGPRGTRVLEVLGYQLLLGAVILYFSATTLGRLSVRSVRDVEFAQQHEGEAPADEAVDDESAATQPRGPFRRRRSTPSYSDRVASRSERNQ